MVSKVYNLLDDESKTVSKKELLELLYALKLDVFDIMLKLDNKPYQQAFYHGEHNAFQICLDLVEHLKE